MLVYTADLYSFFYHAVPPEGSALTLEDLHTIVKDVWLTRHDAELEEERAQRRKGRPKSTKEQKIEELKLRELEVYRTGLGTFSYGSTLFALSHRPPLEVIDLINPENVELFRRWDQTEVAYVEQLRFIRISSDSPQTFTVSRPGRHPALKRVDMNDSVLQEGMETDDVPMLLEPPSRFASTIMTMDGPV